MDFQTETTEDKNELILRPNYSRYGKCAPLKRNEEMVAIADSVLVI